MEDYSVMSDDEFYDVRRAVDREADVRRRKHFNGDSSKILKQLLMMQAIDPDFNADVTLQAEYYITGECHIHADEFLACVNRDTGEVNESLFRSLVTRHVFLVCDMPEDVGIDNSFEFDVYSTDRDAVRHLCKQTYFVPV